VTNWVLSARYMKPRFATCTCVGHVLVMICFCVALAGDIEKECLAMIRERIGAMASLRAAMAAPRLPKTRSGKILGATMRKTADHEEFKVPATIDDPAILDEIAAVLRTKGIGV
jgi:acyl-coenzyme A synthetase/AMP-(fatty) acid ligase